MVNPDHYESLYYKFSLLCFYQEILLYKQANGGRLLYKLFSRLHKQHSGRNDHNIDRGWSYMTF